MKDDQKIKLIKLIEAKGKFWDASAMQTAVDLVRNPGDMDKRRDAESCVLRADLSEKMAAEIIDLIHQYWPSCK